MLDLPRDLARMEEAISRLRAEREGERDRWFYQGSKAAREWVEQQAPYALLRRLGEASPAERASLLKSSPPPELADQLKLLEKERDFSPESYRDGFARTVALLWEVIERNL